VHLNQSRARRDIFKMQGDCFQHVGTEFIPRFRFREDAVTQRPCVKAALLGIANLENQLHGLKYRSPPVGGGRPTRPRTASRSVQIGVDGNDAALVGRSKFLKCVKYGSRVSVAAVEFTAETRIEVVEVIESATHFLTAASRYEQFDLSWPLGGNDESRKENLFFVHGPP